MRYSLGGVSFINSLPFFYGRESDVFDISLNVPSELNAAVVGGKFDASMISRWVYPSCAAEYAVLPNFCIGGDGEIMSIKLMSKFDISELERGSIFITPQTGTSSRAYRRICRNRFGFDIFDLPRKPLDKADTVILIGDAAMLFDSSKFPHCYDLGELWRDWAGCKMLYSVFVVRRSLYAEIAPRLAAFLDASLAAFAADNSRVLARAAEISSGALSRGLLEKYYGRLIYKMGAADFEKSFNFVRENDTFR